LKAVERQRAAPPKVNFAALEEKANAQALEYVASTSQSGADTSAPVKAAQTSQKDAAKASKAEAKKLRQRELSQRRAAAREKQQAEHTRQQALERAELEAQRQREAVEALASWQRRQDETKEARLSHQRRVEREKKLAEEAQLREDANHLSIRISFVEALKGINFKSEPDQNIYPQNLPPLLDYLAVVFANQAPLMSWPNAALTQLPPVFGLFQHVQEVNLAENSLVFVPPALFEMPNLRRLFLHHNFIKALPVLLICPGLQFLDLHSNCLTRLPDLTHLTGLQSLDCEKNEIRDFPTGIEACANLYHLNLKSNQIRIIPRELGSFMHRKLSFLNLRNNPIVNLPPHIYQQGMKATLQFLLDHSGASHIDGDANIASDLKRILMLTLAGHESTQHTLDMGKTEQQLDSHSALEEIYLNSSAPCSIHPSLLCDIILKSTIDGSEYPCHRSIVWARCPAMRPQLKRISQMRPTMETTHLPLVPISAASDHVKMLLHYWYTDRVVFTPIEPVSAKLGMTEYEIAETVALNSQLDQIRSAVLKDNLNLAGKFDHPFLRLMIEIGDHNNEPKLDDRSFSSNTPVSTYKEDLAALLNANHEHDVFFRVPLKDTSTLLSGNRIVMASRSPFLKALFTSGMVESKEMVISLGNISSSVVSAIIEFCYTDDVENLDPETVVELLCTAKLYGLVRLQSIVESIVGYSLDLENVSSLLTLAVDQQMKTLARACKFFVLSNWNAVTSHADWLDVPESIQNAITRTAKKWKVITDGMQQ
jgi:Leucine-rich repeat (LRR) protein